MNVCMYVCMYVYMYVGGLFRFYFSDTSFPVEQRPTAGRKH